jgi:hypothetical protein
VSVIKTGHGRPLTLFAPGGAGEDLVPANLRVTQKYESWLASLSSAGRSDLAAEIFVVGQRGDPKHPADVAQAWAEQLGAHLELLPPKAVSTDPERVIDLLAGFFNCVVDGDQAT